MAIVRASIQQCPRCSIFKRAQGSYAFWKKLVKISSLWSSNAFIQNDVSPITQRKRHLNSQSIVAENNPHELHEPNLHCPRVTIYYMVYCGRIWYMGSVILGRRQRYSDCELLWDARNFSPTKTECFLHDMTMFGFTFNRMRQQTTLLEVWWEFWGRCSLLFNRIARDIVWPAHSPDLNILFT